MFQIYEHSLFTLISIAVFTIYRFGIYAIRTHTPVVNLLPPLGSTLNLLPVDAEHQGRHYHLRRSPPCRWPALACSIVNYLGLGWWCSFGDCQLVGSCRGVMLLSSTELKRSRLEPSITWRSGSERTTSQIVLWLHNLYMSCMHVFIAIFDKVVCNSGNCTWPYL